MEIWKDIGDYLNLYQISDLGNVRSVDRIVRRPKMGNFAKKSQLIRPTKNKGYLSVQLSKNGVLKTHKVHRLVAENFLDKNNFKLMPYEDIKKIDLNKLEVNHINEDKSDNRAKNLEWCTHEYNIKYGTWIIRRKNNFDYSYCSKKVGQYDLNNNLIKIWNSISEAQKELKIAHISDCCNKKRKKAGGYIWKHH